MDPWRGLDELDAWRDLAPEAAVALRRGEGGPARAMLHRWAVAADAERVSGCLAALATADLQPTPQAWTMTMVAAPDLSVPLPTDWRSQVHARADPARRTGDPLAWALVELATLGGLNDAIFRQPWQAERFAVDRDADEAMAGLWAAWADGSILGRRQEWEDATLPAVIGAFSSVLRGRGIPERRRHVAVDDAREGCFYTLLGADDASASWRELAVRVLETAGPDPVEALATALPSSSHDLVARCAVTRGYGPATARLAWGPDSDALVQARNLSRQLRDRPDSLGRMLELHLLTRLVDRWASPACTAPERSWNVIVNNRGRARARLRAVLRRAPADWLVERLVALPGLAARTRRAAARFGRDWVWQALQHGLTLEDSRLLDPECRVGVGFTPYTDDQRAQLRAWACSVVLKGRLPHLLAWVYREGRQDVDLKDATWGRLLKDEIPAKLRSPVSGGPRNAGLQRLRAELYDLLPEALDDLLPVIRAVAGLQYRPRRTGPAFAAAIAPAVHPQVPPPHKQIRRYIAHAAAAVEPIEAFVRHHGDGP
ncbi:MAG: hypothetical protein D6798_19640 [Deltaproteobacteria bacterium]|nr:MAG: hypothetical protein D6798_19640 [Deltaproteobacteria bacterium]